MASAIETSVQGSMGQRFATKLEKMEAILSFLELRNGNWQVAGPARKTRLDYGFRFSDPGRRLPSVCGF